MFKDKIKLKKTEKQKARLIKIKPRLLFLYLFWLEKRHAQFSQFTNQFFCFTAASALTQSVSRENCVRYFSLSTYP